MVKVEPICAACLLHRGLEEAELATPSLELRMEVAKQLIDMLHRFFGPTAVPAKLGVKRDLSLIHI